MLEDNHSSRKLQIGLLPDYYSKQPTNQIVGEKFADSG